MSGLYYIGGNDSCLMDMRCVLGPFDTADRAAAELGAVQRRSRGAPLSVYSGRSLAAEIGDYFGCEADAHLGVLLGPHKTKAAARRDIAEEVLYGATFSADETARFLGVVRYLRQESATAPQVLILERIGR